MTSPPERGGRNEPRPRRGAQRRLRHPLWAACRAERYLSLVLDWLPPERTKAIVLLQDGPFAEQLRAEGREVSVIPTSPRLPGIVRSAGRLRRMLARDRPDLVHANGIKAALVAVVATLGTRVPAVWVKHDLSFDRSLARPLALGCRVVVAVSEAAARTSRDRCGGESTWSCTACRRCRLIASSRAAASANARRARGGARWTARPPLSHEGAARADRDPAGAAAGDSRTAGRLHRPGRPI